MTKYPSGEYISGKVSPPWMFELDNLWMEVVTHLRVWATIFTYTLFPLPFYSPALSLSHLT
ncbi:hypothetical protein J3E69DRAFT_42978 [Trichoderma sp. SZMC 28015]